MVNERVVSVKLEQIEQYHGELKTKQETVSRREFLSSTTEQRAVERMFENAIQACADLAQHVATSEFGFGGTAAKGRFARSIVRGLSTRRRRILSSQRSDSGTSLPTSMGCIDHGEVYETLQTGLAVYDEYSQQVAQWVTEAE